MRDMVMDDQHDVAAFKREAESAKDADLKGWAAKTLPTLQDHLKMVQDTAAKVSAGSPPAKKKSAFMYRRDRTVHLPPGWRVDWLLPSRWDAFSARSVSSHPMWVARREVAGKQYRKLRVGACHLCGRGRARAGRDRQPFPCPC